MDLSNPRQAMSVSGSATAALCAILEDCQYSSDLYYSPMILTNTRFRRPSRLPSRPFRLASNCPLPGARRPSLPTASRCPRSGQAFPRCPRDRPHRCGCATGPEAGVVVDACPERSDRNTLAVMLIAETRVNPLFIIYHSHIRDDRGPGGHRPRPEQTQPVPLIRDSA